MPAVKSFITWIHYKMTTLKFIENGIHYIKDSYDNGTINIYPDPDFNNTVLPNPFIPPLPSLTSTGQKLDFIIDFLNIKDNFLPPP